MKEEWENRVRWVCQDLKDCQERRETLVYPAHLEYQALLEKLVLVVNLEPLENRASEGLWERQASPDPRDHPVLRGDLAKMEFLDMREPGDGPGTGALKERGVILEYRASEAFREREDESEREESPDPKDHLEIKENLVLLVL